jgi:hypothetical protein
MIRRIVAAGLWAFAIYSGGELAWGLLGVPRVVGPVLAIAIASFVFLDPTGRIWTPSPNSRVATIPNPTGPADGKQAGISGL